MRKRKIGGESLEKTFGKRQEEEEKPGIHE